MTNTIPEFNIDLKDRLFLIAGPCVIESRDHVLFMADAIRKIASDFDVPYVFKASFDKANRTSIHSFRGPGMEEGLKLLGEVRKTIGVPVLTDVHLPEQAAPIAKVVDILQIPAFLCRQTDLIVAAANTGKIVNVKKGQFLAPWEMKNVVVKAREAGNSNIVLTERGASFGYNNLVLDVTHSLQLPGGQGDKSGGQPQYIPHLARAGVAAGVDGLFMEVHDNPAKALSDGPNALDLSRLRPLLEQLVKIRRCLDGN
jgi:2-dehydro-3-deoxyphosphooctonate aldolase (KDO 8-P synthase)